MTEVRFRKRPIEVTAIQWIGGNEQEIREFTGGRFRTADPTGGMREPDVTAQVYDVYSGWVGLKTGQWVVRGVLGEFYPLADAVLRETYDPADAGGVVDA